MDLDRPHNEHGICLTNAVHPESFTTISDDELLTRWHTKFSALRTKHIKKAQQCRILYVCLGVISAFCSATGTLFSTIGAVNDELMKVTTVAIVNMLLHFGALFLTASMHFLDLSGRKLKHLNSSHNYANLLRQIEFLRTKPDSEKDIKPILESYYKYIKDEPVISCCC